MSRCRCGCISPEMFLELVRHLEGKGLVPADVKAKLQNMIAAGRRESDIYHRKDLKSLVR
jgi:hypothetical protein